MYCVPHAAAEQLVLAVKVVSGVSVCGGHGAAPIDEPVPPLAAAGSGDDSCAVCGAMPRRAYFVVGHRPLCIRHAADACFPDDDMSAHDMAHAAYLALNATGVTDAY